MGKKFEWMNESKTRWYFDNTPENDQIHFRVIELGCLQRIAASLEKIERAIAAICNRNQRESGIHNSDSVVPNGDGSTSGSSKELPNFEAWFRGLRKRTRRCLGGIKTFSELTEMSMDQLLEIEGFGKSSADDVETNLDAVGLSLKRERL